MTDTTTPPIPYGAPGEWQLLQYKVQQLEKSEAALKESLKNLEQKIEDREQERRKEERRRLYAGISFLGSIVLSLLGLVWTFRSQIIGGGK